MARERLRKEAREFMATYIAHYQSPKGSYERERGLFEFESDARAGTKANAHDARMKMLELFGASAVSWTIEKVERPEYCIDSETGLALIRSIYSAPHGVYAMSHDLEGLVETSTNLAAVKMTADNQIKITSLQRSSVESRKEDIAGQVAAHFQLAGARIVECEEGERLALIGVAVEQLAQQEVAALHLVARHERPFGEGDGFAVGVLEGEGVAAQDVLVQQIANRFEERGVRLFDGALGLGLDDSVQALAAFLGVVLEDVHAV